MNKSIITFGLISLNIVSIWVIISVELDIIPRVPSYFSKEFAEKFNRALLALAYSILSAYIFYWFTFVLPRKILINRSKKILSKEVHQFQRGLFVLINKILHVYDIKKSIEQVEEKDLLHLDGDTSKTLDGIFATSEHWKQFWKKGKKFTGFGNINFKYPDDVYKQLTAIPESIKKIRLSNPNFSADENFAEILSSIETNKIIQWYADGKNKIFLYGGSSRELFNLINDYKRLLKLNYNKPYLDSYHTIRFYTSEEIKKLPEDLNKYITEITPKFEVSRSLIPCIIYNSNYPDSRSLITVLNQGHIITKNGLQKQFLLSAYNNGEISPPSYSKCVIIVGEQIPKKQIKEYIKTYQKNKVIILLKSNLLFSSSTKKFYEKKTTFGIYKIYYRKPIKLLGFHLFSKYPTTKVLTDIRANVSEIMRNFHDTNATKSG